MPVVPRLALALSFAAALGAAPARAQSVAPESASPSAASGFDPAAAAAVVAEAAQKLASVRESQRSVPDRPATLQRAQAQFEDDLRQLQQAVDRLAAKLQAGAGVEESFPLVRRVRTLSRDVQQAAQRAQFPATDLVPLQEGIATLAKLDPWYGGSTLPAAPTAD